MENGTIAFVYVELLKNIYPKVKLVKVILMPLKIGVNGVKLTFL